MMNCFLRHVFVSSNENAFPDAGILREALPQLAACWPGTPIKVKINVDLIT